MSGEIEARLGAGTISERELAILQKAAITPEGPEAVPVIKDGVLSRMTTADFRKMLPTFDVRDFGAVGDGVTDDAPAIQAAIDAAGTAGGGLVVFPSGEFRCHAHALVLADKVYLQGSGSGSTVLNFAGNLAESPALGLIRASGEATALPALGQAVEAGDRVLHFATSHNLAPGDVISIVNTQDFSYLAAQPYYREGEFLRVGSVLGSTSVEVTTHLFAAHLAAEHTQLRKLELLQTGLSGFAMQFAGGSNVVGIRLNRAGNVRMEDLDLTQANNSLIELRECYEIALHKIRGIDYQAPIALNYALKIISCQKLALEGCFFETTRHGVATGSSGGDLSIVPREISFTNCHVSSRGDSWGFDSHIGENFVITGCNLPQGLVVGSDHFVITGNVISNEKELVAFNTRNLRGVSFNISNNLFLAAGPTHQTAGLTRNLLIFAITGNVNRPGGQLNIANNTFVGKGFGGGVLVTVNAAHTNPLDIGVKIQGNSVMRSTSGAGITIQGQTAAPIKHVVISGNDMEKCQLRVTRRLTNAEIRGNSIIAGEFGIFVPTETGETSSVWNIENNTVRDCEKAGILIRLPATAVLKIADNESVNNGQEATTTANNSCDVDGGSHTVIMRGNLFGNTPGSTSQNRAAWVRGAQNLYFYDNIILGGLANLLTADAIYGGFENIAGPRVHYATAAPTSGTWRRGDITWNTQPSASATPGWVCVTGGSSGGTWKAMADLEA